MIDIERIQEKLENLYYNGSNKLKPIKFLFSEKNKHYYFFKCDCGNEKKINKNEVLNGKTKSCGCLQKQMAKKANTKHGMCKTKLKYVYSDMKGRCLRENHKAYKNYGGRGINVCKEWLDKENGFINFYNWSINNGYKEGLSIDRINNDGNYEPNNCRFADRKIQNRNQRSNINIYENGIKLTLTEYCKLKNLNYSTIHGRINNYGYSIEEAIKLTNKEILEKFSKKIVCFKDNFFKEYESINKASKELNISSKLISLCCRNKQKQSKGFKFMFKNDFDFMINQLDYLTSEFHNEELLKEYNWYLKILKGSEC